MLARVIAPVRESFAHPLVAVIILIMAAVSLTTFLVMQRSQRLIIEHEATKIAEVVARQALASRSVYTAAVADKLAHEGSGPDIEYLKKRGHVPLPSQFLKLVGHEASEHSAGLYRYRPLSKWNLEPTQGLNDDFQRWAWDALERQDQPNPRGPIDWKPVWRVEEVNGVRTLRYLRADSAASPSCVDCHNQYEVRPETTALRAAAGVSGGKQWKRHQLLGAIEIDIPVDHIEALAAGQSWQTLALVVAISLIGLAIAAWFAFHDIRRKQMLAAQFERQARFDSLTGLANRMQFQEQARVALARAGRENRPAGVLFVDLDHFKRINDSLGHELGDRVIQEVGRRLLGSLREIDLLARHSGDEFTIVLNATDGVRDFARTARRVIEVVSQPLTFDGKELFLSASIGISCFPRDGYDVETLVKNADIAMYRAKEQGRNNYQFFSREMDNRALETLSLSNHLRHAVGRRQLRLHYQPRVEGASGRITAVEATLRWRHPELGLLEPARFIRIAEDTGMIEAIGEWALTEACAQARRWDRLGLPPLRVSVNLSARQFRAVDFVDKVSRILSVEGVAPERLELEITESVLMQQPDAAEIVLAQLHALGITLSIDDFGTGYSSLSYLKRFPIGYLKIDKSFIDGLPTDNNDRVICDAIIALGRNLGVKVVAEGVETVEQRRFLAERRCDELQGFLFARPATADALEPLLRRGRFPVEIEAPLQAEHE